MLVAWFSGGVLKSSGTFSKLSTPFFTESPRAPAVGRATPASSTPARVLNPRNFAPFFPAWIIERFAGMVEHYVHAQRPYG
ncbi:hypothetical protein ASE03_23600 [Kitasatospora sp. Root187]|nr:hypothetical protein ASE03_23600 [Kitasatospora sp. Root187]